MWDPTIFLISLLAGTATFLLVYGLIGPRPSSKGVMHSAVMRKRLAGVQSWLDEEQLDISTGKFVMQSLLIGVPLGIGLSLVVGALSLFVFGVFAGFLLTKSKLERERDLKMVEYNKQLAGACDILRNAFGVTGSFQSALQAAASYGGEAIKQDFDDLLFAYKQGRFAERVNEIANKRRSIVFDTLGNTLMRASTTNTDSALTEILERLGESTRMTTSAFDEATTRQISAREQIVWAAFGPWGVFAVLRIMILIMTVVTSTATLTSVATFFSTFWGNIVAAAMACMSASVYVYSNGVSRRGLVIKRIISQPVANIRRAQ